MVVGLKHLTNVDDSLRYMLLPFERMIICNEYIPTAIGYIYEW